MQSWRYGTKKQYVSGIRICAHYNDEKEINPSIGDVLEFITSIIRG